MATDDLHVVLDAWVAPADQVPLVFHRGGAVVQVHVNTAEAVAKLTEIMERVKDATVVFNLIVQGADLLEPARPADREPGA